MAMKEVIASRQAYDRDVLRAIALASSVAETELADGTVDVLVRLRDRDGIKLCHELLWCGLELDGCLLHRICAPSLLSRRTNKAADVRSALFIGCEKCDVKQ